MMGSSLTGAMLSSRMEQHYAKLRNQGLITIKPLGRALASSDLSGEARIPFPPPPPPPPPPL